MKLSVRTGLSTFVIFLLIGAFLLYTNRPKPTSVSPVSSPSLIPSQPVQKKTPLSYSLFFPYWTLPKNTDTITLPAITDDVAQTTAFIYFGVAPDSDGSIQKSDSGFTNLTQFVEHPQIQNGKKLLTLRMINDDVNNDILDDAGKQNKLLIETLDLMKKHDFDGIVLDLEVKGLPTQNLINKITGFAQRASQMTHEQNASFGLTLYGDVYYRARPYDVSRLADFSDQLYIMAYDFHKSAGTPGPNFPASGAEKYGYDLNRLIDDLEKQVTVEKITIVFGLFGHDWIVDEQKRPIKPAAAKTRAQIQKEYLDGCESKNCTLRRDPQSAESEISFVDSFGNLRIVWFEDEQSIKYKVGAAAAKNVANFSFWAYGYY